MALRELSSSWNPAHHRRASPDWKASAHVCGSSLHVSGLTPRHWEHPKIFGVGKPSKNLDIWSNSVRIF
jgi:hypothetical protein